MEIVSKLRHKWKSLGQEKQVIVFIVLLLAANLVWKLCVWGSASNPHVTFLGLFNISWCFNWAIRPTAWLATQFASLFCPGAKLVFGDIIVLPNEHALEVVWGCTAIKQTVLFVIILLFSAGEWRKKMAYILLSIVVIFFANVIRIGSLAIVLGIHSGWAPVLHNWIMKYAFYAFLLFLWIVWQELIRRGYVKTKENVNK